MKVKEYIKRFSNVGTIISVVGLVGLLLVQFGINVDMVWLENTIKIVCGLFVVLGICNNPDTNGLDLPSGFDKKESNKNE